MRFRFIAVTFFAVIASACGGGGGGAPGPTPTPQPARLAAAGDSFSYVGTLTENFTRFPEPSGPPVPSPVQSNSQTFTSAVTQQVAVTAGATFGGTNGLFDFKTTESDVQQSPAKTLGITTDAFYAFPAPGATGVVMVLGSSAATTDGATFLTTYGVGNGLVDVLPEIAGPVGHANNAALTVKETDPDGQVTTRITNADGSYVETAAYPDGSSATATENADGSGTYSFPLGAVGTNTTFTVSPVATGPAGPAIPITIVYAAGTFSATAPTTVARSISPVWYSKTPPVLSTETYVNQGSQPLPGACNVPAAFGTSGNRLVATNAKVDTIFGEIDTLTTTTHTIPGVGVACVESSDIVGQFYDFTGQTRRLIGTFATPIQITTTSEIVGLTAESLKSGARSLSVGHPSGVAARALALDSENFRVFLERRRVQRHAFAHRRLKLSGGSL